MNTLFRYTTDIISSVVYGYKCQSMKEPNNDFLRLGVKAFESGRIILLFAIWHPDILNKITLRFFGKSIGEFFAKIFYDTMDYRPKKNIVRKDFFNLLMQLVNDGELEDDEKHANSNKKEASRKNKNIIKKVFKPCK